MSINAGLHTTYSPEFVNFDRGELNILLGFYGQKVAAAEWRDYGISHLREMAVFAVYRRSAEYPLYQIIKRPALRHKQGMYSIVSVDGRILKRGHDLRAVLRVLDSNRLSAVK